MHSRPSTYVCWMHLLLCVRPMQGDGGSLFPDTPSPVNFVLRAACYHLGSSRRYSGSSSVEGVRSQGSAGGRTIHPGNREGSVGWRGSGSREGRGLWGGGGSVTSEGRGLQVDGVCCRGTQPGPQQSLAPGTSWSGTNSEGVFLSRCFPIRPQLPGEAPEC